MAKKPQKNRVGKAIKESLKNCKAVSLGWQVLDAECSYWFLRIKLDLDKLKVDKDTFCKALQEEGFPVNPSYRHIQCEKPWFENKAVFGKSGFPWNCSDYKGNRKPQYNLKNAIKVTDTHFNITINENFRQQEIESILATVKNLESAYCT